MSDDHTIHDGSGNIFADMAMPAAEERLAKAGLARVIRGVLRERGLTRAHAGTLDVAYRISTFACYACSDGEAGSYSRSVSLPADSIPPMLAEWTRAPEPVRLYWRGTPPRARAGWSRVDAADPAAALARFRAR
jgi:hypothetical protein